MKDRERSQKEEGMKTTADRSAKLIKLMHNCEALARTGPMSSLGEISAPTRNSLQSVFSPAENTPSSVREILAKCGLPIEEIFRKILIPKLYAKEIKVTTTSDGRVETTVVDNHDIQLKTAFELAKMCGCYPAGKRDGDMDHTDQMDQTAQGDMSKISDDELKTFIAISSKIQKPDSVG